MGPRGCGKVDARTHQVRQILLDALEGATQRGVGHGTRRVRSECVRVQVVQHSLLCGPPRPHVARPVERLRRRRYITLQHGAASPHLPTAPHRHSGGVRVCHERQRLETAALRAPQRTLRWQ